MSHYKQINIIIYIIMVQNERNIVNYNFGVGRTQPSTAHTEKIELKTINIL